jgi:hypothetical protein
MGINNKSIRVKMNRQLMFRKGAIGAIFCFLFSGLYSQIDNIDFLKAGIEDGAAIGEAYLKPWANALGAGISGNWYNTAKPHKLGGFDVNIGASMGFIPSVDNSFDVSALGLKAFTGTGTAPTVSGINVEGPTLSGPVIGGIPPVTFRTPQGANWGYLPVPSVQAGIGLPLGSEVKLRYIPQIPIGKGDISSWGVGILHSIMQYIPGNKVLPLDVSVFGGYTKLTLNTPIDFQPDDPQFYTSQFPDGSFDNQNLEIVMETWNASAIASFNLPVISFYGGLGYTKTSTVINLTGYYPIPTINPALSTSGPVYEDAGVIKDFPEIDIKNYSGLRGNIGFRLKFGFFTIHADYTRALYNIVSTGFGFTFR